MRDTNFNQGEKMKIFIVTTGEYDDYSINSVYTTKETANLKAELLNAVRYHGHARVEEHNTTETASFVAYQVTRSFPYKRDKRGRYMELETNANAVPVITRTPATAVFEVLPEPALRAAVREGRPEIYVGSAWGKSYEEAETALYEAIAQLKAEALSL
jgi:hypothetical protein